MNDNNMEKLIEELRVFVENMRLNPNHKVYNGYLVGTFEELINRYHSTENKGGDKCPNHKHGEPCVVTEKNGGWDVSMNCLATPCIKEDSKYHTNHALNLSPKPDTTEPLAVLAARKGLRLCDQYCSDGVWYVWFKKFEVRKKEFVITQTNYQAVEAACREYLSALPDIGGMK